MVHSLPGNGSLPKPFGREHSVGGGGEAHHSGPGQLEKAHAPRNPSPSSRPASPPSFSRHDGIHGIA
jgi:hypothetical protein